MKRQYDFLVVGAGLFGVTFAHMAKSRGKRCLVIDKRAHLGGNVFCENVEGITVHKYGPHIFHTSDKDIWDFVNSMVPFNQFTLNVIANYKGQLYSLPLLSSACLYASRMTATISTTVTKVCPKVDITYLSAVFSMELNVVQTAIT